MPGRCAVLTIAPAYTKLLTLFFLWNGSTLNIFRNMGSNPILATKTQKLAHLVEHQTLTLTVVGSIPTLLPNPKPCNGLTLVLTTRSW